MASGLETLPYKKQYKNFDLHVQKKTYLEAGSSGLEKDEGMLGDIKYFSSFVCKRIQTINVTSGIEFVSMSKTSGNQIIKKYKEILSNTCSYAEMVDTKFIISTDL